MAAPIVPVGGDQGSGVQKPHSGIPEAVFVEDVDAYMQKQSGDGQTTENVLQKLDEMHNKYKFMEMNLMNKKRRLKMQVPDIKNNLDILKVVKERKNCGSDMESRFLLSEQVYLKAKIPPNDRVCLWLGANVMLEYTLDDAEALLTKNLSTAEGNTIKVQDDLNFLRDQYTTTEVNMARVYNWNVKQKQLQKAGNGTE